MARGLANGYAEGASKGAGAGVGPGHGLRFKAEGDGSGQGRPPERATRAGRCNEVSRVRNIHLADQNKRALCAGWRVVMAVLRRPASAGSHGQRELPFCELQGRTSRACAAWVGETGPLFKSINQSTLPCPAVPLPYPCRTWVGTHSASLVRGSSRSEPQAAGSAAVAGSAARKSLTAPSAEASVEASAVMLTSAPRLRGGSVGRWVGGSAGQRVSGIGVWAATGSEQVRAGMRVARVEGGMGRPHSRVIGRCMRF